MFRAQIEESLADEAFYDACAAHWGEDKVPFDDFAVDYYDESVELYDARVASLTEAEQAFLFGLAFRKVYVNATKMRETPRRTTAVHVSARATLKAEREGTTSG